MMIVYLAEPIDYAGDDAFWSSIRHTVTTDLHRHEIGYFTPKLAFTVSKNTPITDQIQNINDHALENCDGVIALLPSKTRTIGVPREIGLAQGLRIPHVVIADSPVIKTSWALKSTPSFAPQDARMAVVELKQQMLNQAANPMLTAQALPFVVGGGGQLPTRGYAHDAGLDLYYSGKDWFKIQPQATVNLPVGVRVGLPPDVWGMVVGRSSTFRDKQLLVNTAVIDPGWRGDLEITIRNLTSSGSYVVEPGERLAQLVPLPALNYLQPVEVETLPLALDGRGENGFGSTG